MRKKSEKSHDREGVRRITKQRVVSIVAIITIIANLFTITVSAAFNTIPTANRGTYSNTPGNNYYVHMTTRNTVNARLSMYTGGIGTDNAIFETDMRSLYFNPAATNNPQNLLVEYDRVFVRTWQNGVLVDQRFYTQRYFFGAHYDNQSNPKRILIPTDVIGTYIMRKQ